MKMNTTKRRTAWLMLLTLGLLVLAGCAQQNGSGASATGAAVTVFKDASCGCCSGYIAELQRQGFAVDTRSMPNMNLVKADFGIPAGMQSCHTSKIGNYFVEGHVPIEAIRKLLAEQPAIEGIMLPRMPSGAPGMPGLKEGPFIVQALSQGKVSEFMRV